MATIVCLPKLHRWFFVLDLSRSHRDVFVGRQAWRHKRGDAQFAVFGRNSRCRLPQFGALRLLLRVSLTRMVGLSDELDYGKKGRI